MEEIENNQTEFLNDCSLRNEFKKNGLMEHALYYASIGYPVFPLQNVVRNGEEIRCSCKFGKDCGHIAKHPRTRYGFKEATTDASTVREWWKKYPNANIAILTGQESGIFVLDIDVDKGGQYALEDLSDYYKDAHNLDGLPATLTAISGSGGKHYYFKYNLDVGGIGSSAGMVGQGIDVRADGAYIIAPPSLHPCGYRYEWFGHNVPILDAPDWLLYEILNSEKSIQEEQNSEESNAKIRQKVKVGQRHNELVKYVCGLVNTFSEEEVLQRTYAFCDQYFEPNLKQGYIKYQVNYLFNKYSKRTKNRGSRK